MMHLEKHLDRVLSLPQTSIVILPPSSMGAKLDASKVLGRKKLSFFEFFIRENSETTLVKLETCLPDALNPKHSKHIIVNWILLTNQEIRQDLFPKDSRS